MKLKPKYLHHNEYSNSIKTPNKKKLKTITDRYTSTNNSNLSNPNKLINDKINQHPSTSTNKSIQKAKKMSARKRQYQS